MLSRFFLDRPVFAWVIAIAMMLAGGLAIYNLPVSQYPPIAPPSISIRAAYPGASAKTVEDSVTQIIEQKMTGLDRMLYMSATSDASGAAALTLTFAPGTDPDLAWAKVQNKLQLALPMLPDVVQSRGLTVSKSTRNYLMLVGLTSDLPGTKVEDLGDYAVSTVETVLARVPGVGEVEIMGAGYAMRIWLDPDRLTKYGMTASDVTSAIRTYNAEVSAGQLGGAPAVPGQRLNASILVQSLLVTPEEFANIPLRTNADGSVVRVRDVGRTELGTELADIQAQYNGLPAAMLAIRQEAGANALETANGVKAAMEDLSKYFPAGMRVIYPMDTTPFIRVAIGEVVRTLIEAVILVFFVMYLFLGNLRATLVPTIAVPVVILGTFGVLGALGYSINMLTMFAMVLAIGLLVDDAIVVVENVERVMSEEGLPPREATRKSMDEITSALIGIGLVLAAVFGPMMFFPGSTGVIYRQFSVTVIASMLLSVVVALVLSPVLCASLLRPVAKGHEAAESGFWLLRPFFLWFDRVFYRSAGRVQGRGRSHPEEEAALRGGVPRDRGRPRGALLADAHRVPARRGPGDPHGHRPAARRRHARADRGGARRDQDPLRGAREGRGRVLHGCRRRWHGRPRTEPGDGLRQDAGLGPQAQAGTERKGGGRAGDDGALAHQGSQHLLRAAAARHRAGHRDRLRLHAPGSRRARPRRAVTRARPVDRHGSQGPAPHPGAAQRHAGRSAVQGGHRLGEGRGAGRAGQLDPELSRRRPSAVRTSTTSSRAVA